MVITKLSRKQFANFGTWVRIPLTPPNYIGGFILEENRKKEIIKIAITLFVLVMIFIIVVIIMMRYQVEGETNMPFNLSKVTVVSTAEGISQGETTEKWNLEVVQDNDLYFTIEKNENYQKEEVIQNIKIENIQIIKEPQVGQVKIYMPNSLEGRTFQNKESFLIQDKRLTYQGAVKSNLKTLEIGNQGGMVAIRIANTELGNYISNEDEEITHDGTLIQKLGYEKETISFTVSFDFIIELKNKSYKTTMQLEMPCADIIEQGTGNQEIIDTKQFIFKRM